MRSDEISGRFLAEDSGSRRGALQRGRVNLGVGVINVGRSKTEAGYRDVDMIFAALHQDLGDHAGGL